MYTMYIHVVINLIQLYLYETISKNVVTDKKDNIKTT